MLKRLRLLSKYGGTLCVLEDKNAFEPSLADLQARYPDATALEIDVQIDSLWHHVMTLFF